MAQRAGELCHRVTIQQKTKVYDEYNYETEARAVVSDPAALAFIESFTERNSNLLQSFLYSAQASVS